jgi:hypothetical protein
MRRQFLTAALLGATPKDEPPPLILPERGGSVLSFSQADIRFPSGAFSFHVVMIVESPLLWRDGRTV